MNKFLVGAVSFCLLAGCAMPPQTASTQSAAAKAACRNAGPATGSHIADTDDCGGYASGAVKHAQLYNAQSGSPVLGGAH
jgi:hypothetical protein